MLHLQGLTLKRHIDATLGQGNIKEAVRLPPGEDLNEWLAVNTVDFYNAISVLHGTLEEFCTPSVCPAMAAGAKVPAFFKLIIFGAGTLLVILSLVLVIMRGQHIWELVSP